MAQCQAFDVPSFQFQEIDVAGQFTVHQLSTKRNVFRNV